MLPESSPGRITSSRKILYVMSSIMLKTVRQSGNNKNKKTRICDESEVNGKVPAMPLSALKAMASG